MSASSSVSHCNASTHPLALPTSMATLPLHALCAQDPHYIGAMDEEAIFKGGYVKWHGLDLFTASSFYNFCLPQAVQV